MPNIPVNEITIYSMTKPILYNFKKYDIPVMGIFRVETGLYGKDGWIRKEEQNLIIGETENMYVTKLYESGHGEWVGNEIIQHEYILPSGPHKSRLVKWMPTQINLL